MKQHIKQYPAKRGFACGGAVKKRGMVDGGVAGRNYPVSLSDSIPAASASGMAALASVANSPAQTAAPPGAPLASVRQFGDFSSQQAQQAGADIPAAAPGSSLGPADQFSWRVMPKTDATQQPAAPQSAQQTMAISAPAATPLLTMAEKDRAAGHNPNGPYRYDQMGNKQWIGETKQTQVANANKFAELVGQPAKTVPFTDPLGETIASSARRARRPAFADGGAVKETPEQMLARMSSKYGLGDTGNGASPQPTKQAAPQPAPAPTQQPAAQGGMMGKTTDAIGRRNDELRRVSNFGDGGLIPVNIGKGLMDAVVQPIAEDWRQGNKAIKTLRDQYPTADNIAGIHPAVAAAQVANDVMAGNVGGDTAMNVAQAVPMVKSLSGMAKMLSKQAGPTVGNMKFVVDMPNTVRKNTILTGAQAVGQPANAFADGGMVSRVKDLSRGAAQAIGEFLNVGKPNEAVVKQPEARYNDNQILVPREEGRADMPQERKQSFMAETARRGQQMREAMNYGDGGMVRFAGKGGPRDDKIPVKVAGESINVSDGENAVILPAKTAANQQAVGLIGQIIQATNDGRAPNMGGRGFAQGGKVLEGTVETAEEIAARAARQAGLPVQQVQAIAAPQPGTAVVPRTIDWTPGGNPPPGGALQPRTVDWTYGEGGGPRPAGMAQSASTQAPQVQAIDGPHDAMRADSRTMGRTASGARAGGAMSPEAAAFEASRATSAPAQVVEPAPHGRIAQAAGKIGKYLAPAAKFAAAADIASNAYKSGRDGGAIQIEPSEQQMRDYQTQGGMARFASAAKHGLTAGALNVADAATGVIDSAASLPNLVLPAMAQIPSAQEHYRGLVKETFSPSGAAAAHGTATIRDEKPRGEQTPGMVQAAIGNEGRSGAILNSVSPANVALRAGTGNAGDAAVTPSGNLRFTQPGFDPTQQRFSDGTGAMTSAKTGKTMVVTPGRYTAADGSETDDWSKTQAYADAIKRNQADKVRLAEMQAERLGGNPQDILQKSQGMAQAAAESSLNQQAKRQAIETGQVSLEQAQQLQSLGQLMTEGKTPEVRAEAARAYHVMTGKGRDAPQEQYDNIVVKDYDQNGMVVGEHIEQRPKNRSVAAMPAAQQYEVKAGMSVTAPDGVHTFQGKTITVKAGKVVEVK